MPLWHINAEMTTEGIRRQMRDAHDAGFTGVTPLPMATYKHKVGTTPPFLSPDYFDRYQDLIDIAVELKMEVIVYDDNDFPSGMAGGELAKRFPEHTLKRLDMLEADMRGPATFSQPVEAIQLMAAVATHAETGERIEISDHFQDGILTWEVPEGSWRIFWFPLVQDRWVKAYPLVDYLDPAAVREWVRLTYDQYADKFGSHFGTTIKKFFFDDVGFWQHPRAWTGRFNQVFEEMHGMDPRPVYPALWFDIGPETASVRNAFHATRAELLAEGFPKQVAEWCGRHGLQSTGHPPGNYDPSPIDMNGDIFKFYRYTQMPLVDIIIKYQFGQHGHKLISSAAEFYDRPIVATEIYGAFRERDQHVDTRMLYRAMFETFARGANFVIPHGMWYDPDPEKVYIPPLISSYNEEIAEDLPAYSTFVSRCCSLLQGGRRVSDIGVLYPFEELAAAFSFHNPDKIRQGFFISPETDYLILSGILTNELRRDFTFLHPELILEEKYSIENGTLTLNNVENFQTYSVLFLTGCNTISVKALEKLRAFYLCGGKILSTTRLPCRSSEPGEDRRVVELIEEIFGIHPLKTDPEHPHTHSNANGGCAVHLPHPAPEAIQPILDEWMAADVSFHPNPVLQTDWGKFNSLHKIKDGRHIYLFTNSSDEDIDTEVILRGRLNLEAWNPHTGDITDLSSEFFQQNGTDFTRVNLKLNAVTSVFWVTPQCDGPDGGTTKKKHRVLVGRLFHESHTFLEERTGSEGFEIRMGADMLRAEGDHSPLDGILTSARSLGWEVVPAADIFGMPGAAVRDEVLERFIQALRDAVGAAPGIDGVCLALHGAMVTESCDDVEGAVVRELRGLLGDAVPIFGILDLHGNIGTSLQGKNLGFFSYRENPHNDACEAAARCARELDCALSSGIPRHTMVRRLPLLWAPIATGTNDSPMADLENLARELERAHPELRGLSVFAGYAYADTPDTGVCLTAVHVDGVGAVAAAALDQLESLAIALDGRARVSFATPEEILEGIRQAEHGEAPRTVILVESSDNIGGGAPGDGTGALRFILNHGIGNALLAINDPDAVRLCRAGETVRLALGGKGSSMDDGPVEIDAVCRSVHKGLFELEDKRSHLASMQGARFDMGPCAVVQSEGTTLLITTRKTPPMDLGQFRSVGIEPSDYRVIAVKAAVAYRDAYASIPHRAFHLDTAGPCTSRLDRFPYLNLNPQPHTNP